MMHSAQSDFSNYHLLLPLAKSIGQTFDLSLLVCKSNASVLLLPAAEMDTQGIIAQSREI